MARDAYRGTRELAHESKKAPRSPATPWPSYGDEGDRTPDPDTASVVLSQLSYIPMTDGYFTVLARDCQARNGELLNHDGHKEHKGLRIDGGHNHAFPCLSSVVFVVPVVVQK